MLRPPRIDEWHGAIEPWRLEDVVHERENRVSRADPRERIRRGAQQDKDQESDDSSAQAAPGERPVARQLPQGEHGSREKKRGCRSEERRVGKECRSRWS